MYSESGFVRSIQLPSQLSGADFVGCTASDTFVFAKLPDRILGVGLHVLPVTVLAFHPSENSVAQHATLRGTEMFISERYSAFYERPFGVTSFVAAGRTGVVTAESDRLELRRLTADGTFERVFSVPSEPRSPAEGARGRYLIERVAEEPDSASRRTLRAVLEETPWGESLPEVDRLLVARSGEIWLRRAAQSEDSLVEWLIVDVDSGAVHRIALPRTLRVLFADRTRILALQATPDGYERLMELVYRDANVERAVGR